MLRFEPTLTDTDHDDVADHGKRDLEHVGGRRAAQLILLFALAALVTAACSDSSAVETTVTGPPAEGLFEPFDASDFSRPTEITNQWLPLRPGSRLVWEGFTVDEGDEVPHRIVSTVTNVTKLIGEIQTVVVWEEDYADGELVEAEIAFFAQDDQGNVWLFGEYPQEYEDGKIIETPTWLAGYQDARPGIAMMADPRSGTPSYAQGWGPAVEWDDRGQVFATGESTCVPVDCYEDVLVIDEFDLDEPSTFQVKYYAAGVGNVQVGWKGPDPNQETLELDEITRLDAAGLDAAGKAALKLDSAAYETSPEVYGQTQPAEVTSGS